MLVILGGSRLDDSRVLKVWLVLDLRLGKFQGHLVGPTLASLSLVVAFWEP